MYWIELSGDGTFGWQGSFGEHHGLQSGRTLSFARQLQQDFRDQPAAQ